MQRRVLMERANHRRQGMMMPPRMMPPYMMGMNPMMMSPQQDMGNQGGMMSDGRNPYGAKGGYVDSDYQDNRGRGRRDNAMDSMDRGSEYRSGQDYRDNADSRRQDYHMGPQPYGQYLGGMQFYGYGVGMPQNQGMMMGQGDYGVRTHNQAYSRHNADFNDYNQDMRRNDYGDMRRDYGDYGDYGNYGGGDYADYNDYAMEEKEYHKKLHEWTNKLKAKDRFGVPKEQVMKQAENMGVKFDKFTPEEFYATYLMMVSDYKKVANDYNMYISLAKDWLEDDDVKVKGGDKLCAYLYYVVLGEKK